MKKIGILTTPGKGHANPLCALGRELNCRGYSVTVISAPDAEHIAEAAGLNFVAIASSAYPLGGAIERQNGLGSLTGVAASKAISKSFSVLFRAFFEEAIPLVQGSDLEFLIVRTIVDIVKLPFVTVCGAALIIVDQALLIGRTIVDIVKLPFVTVCGAALINPSLEVPSILSPFNHQANFFGKLLNTWSYIWHQRHLSIMIKTIHECRKEAGLHTALLPMNAEKYINSPIATIVPMPRSLEFPRPDLSNHTHFIGTLATPKARPNIPFPWDKLEDNFIYASLGTTYNPKEILLQVAQACDRLNRQAVISLGGHKQSLPFPESAIVVDYAPQLELLEKAALCVTHAGLNTTIEALSRGVPLLAIPITSDQPGVSSRIKYAGVGDRILLEELSIPLLAERIEKVLGDPVYKTNAIKMAQEIEQAGGVKRAADIVEQAIATNQPVPYWWNKDPETLPINA